MSGPETFPFIVSTDAGGFKKAATLTVVRQHASRKGSRARRANLAIGGQIPGQLPPEDEVNPPHLCDHDIPEDADTMQQHCGAKLNLRQAVIASTDIKGVGRPQSVPGHTSLLETNPHFASAYASNHSICRLGRDWSDLIQICPNGGDLATQRIVKRCKSRFLTCNLPYQRNCTKMNKLRCVLHST